MHGTLMIIHPMFPIGHIRTNIVQPNSHMWSHVELVNRSRHQTHHMHQEALIWKSTKEA